MSQICWRAWSEEAFADAQAQNKPVLLAIGAPWCQWCRAMDEQTYHNEAIIQYLEEHFVAIRVDSDKRPDINARYSMGGLPSTCILTPEGDLLWGQTFVPPDAMAQVLPQTLNAYHNDKAGLAQHVAQQREQIAQQTTPPPLDTSLPVTQEVTRSAIAGAKLAFDFANGGFGREQKFPHVDAIELCLQQYARGKANNSLDGDLQIMLDKTLRGISEGGLHDREDGGFFRYTQTADWREPHYEKLLEDNALLARTFTHAYQLLGDERWKRVAEKTFRYLDEFLYDADRGAWCGSQRADEEYYAQPAAERAEWNPPAADRTILCGPNAQAARAHVTWWQATGDRDALAKARRALDFVLENLLREDGALQHYIPEDDAQEQAVGGIPAGLLGDAADVVAACLDLYEAGQGADYLDTAEQVADWVRGHLEDPRGGGLFDSVIRADAVGNLKYRTKDLTDNMQMADAVLRLYLATGEEEHARLAQRTMQAFVPASAQLGLFGVGLALAAERAIHPPVLVYLLGAADTPATDALLAGAHRPYRYERFVQPLDPSNEDDAEHISSLGYPASDGPVAHVSVGERVHDPVSDPEQLAELVRTAR